MYSSIGSLSIGNTDINSLVYNRFNTHIKHLPDFYIHGYNLFYNVLTFFTYSPTGYSSEVTDTIITVRSLLGCSAFIGVQLSICFHQSDFPHINTHQSDRSKTKRMQPGHAVLLPIVYATTAQKYYAVYRPTDCYLVFL